jgi:hypothetical protein
LLLVGGILSQKTFAQYYAQDGFNYDNSAPMAGTQTGSNMLTVGLGLVVVGAVAAVIVATSDNDHHTSHNH